MSADQATKEEEVTEDAAAETEEAVEAATDEEVTEDEAVEEAAEDEAEEPASDRPKAKLGTIVGEKLGMTQIFTEDSRAVPVTVIKVGPCYVTQIKTKDNDGYKSVQISFGETKPSRLNSPESGHFAKAGVAPARHLVEVRVDSVDGFELGQEVDIESLFEKGSRADVTGVSKGKGFSGVMKRHNFKGQGASHGNHKKHRAPGSIGACATPARVFKGMKMAGRMGGDRTTILNLEVVQVDAERGLLALGGAVPGAKGSVVVVRGAVKSRA